MLQKNIRENSNIANIAEFVGLNGCSCHRKFINAHDSVETLAQTISVVDYMAFLDSGHAVLVDACDQRKFIKVIIIRNRYHVDNMTFSKSRHLHDEAKTNSNEANSVNREGHHGNSDIAELVGWSTDGKLIKVIIYGAQTLLTKDRSNVDNITFSIRPSSYEAKSTKRNGNINRIHAKTKENKRKNNDPKSIVVVVVVVV
jgi:hypothetical protein